MLRSLKDLKQYAVHAIDGDIGHVRDFYFDDSQWTVRYLILDTSEWLMGHQVLISPYSFGKPDWNKQSLPVNITREQVKKSPSIDTDKPVSRQHEGEFLGYYGYPYYWGGSGLWGGGMYPTDILANLTSRDGPIFNKSGSGRSKAEQQRDRDQSHLRSCKEVIDYHVHASDGDIGHVSDMLVDQKTWAIRYLIVDTSNWWMGHKVLIAPLWIEQINWPDKKVTVDLTRQQIKDAVTYDPSIDYDRNHETALFQHYGKANYWELEQTDPAYEAYD